MPGSSLIYWVLILGVFYFFLIAPEKKKQKKAQAMLNSLKIGDSVMTRGGILGTIVSMDEQKLVIESGPDNVKFAVARYAVAALTQSEIEKVNTNTEAALSETEPKEHIEYRENETVESKEINED